VLDKQVLGFGSLEQHISTCQLKGSQRCRKSSEIAGFKLHPLTDKQETGEKWGKSGGPKHLSAQFNYRPTANKPGQMVGSILRCPIGPHGNGSLNL